MNEAFGMMDEGYFTSRGEIITWINDLLKLNITKIEQLGSGAVYCQVLDAMFPGKVPITKVNFKAKLEYEFINNLKILQASFAKLEIKRAIEVERLSKCKYQDNLEMIQWLKRFYDCNSNSNKEYDAVGRRKQSPDFSFADKTVVPKIFNVQTSHQQSPPEVKKQRRASQNGIVESAKENANINVPLKKTESMMKQQISSVGKAPLKRPPATKEEGQLLTVKQIVLNTDMGDSEKVRQIAFILGIQQNKTSNIKEFLQEDEGAEHVAQLVSDKFQTILKQGGAIGHHDEDDEDVI